MPAPISHEGMQLFRCIRDMQNIVAEVSSAAEVEDVIDAYANVRSILMGDVLRTPMDTIAIMTGDKL